MTAAQDRLVKERVALAAPNLPRIRELETALARSCECDAPRCEREGCQDKPMPSAASVREQVDRASTAQRMEHVEQSAAIRDAAVYGVGWIKYVWDHQAQRARPVRVHPETVQVLSEWEAMNDAHH